MKRRTFLRGLGGVGAGAVLLNAGCNPSREGAVGGRPTVRTKSWESLGYPSPFTYTAGPGYWRMTYVFDTLLWKDATGKQLPWLASSYTPSPDGLVHTLNLRGVKWDDGRPLTAGDVVFTYEYYTSRTFTPLLVGLPRPGIHVRPVGDKTVEFRLDKPDATFEQFVLGTMPIVPQHIWSKIDDPMGTFDKRVLISTGAYELKSHDDNLGTELYVAKDNYFMGRPFVRRIEGIDPAKDDELATLRAGACDAGGGPAEGTRNDQLAPFVDDPSYGILRQPAGFAFPLFFNMKKGGALADLRFRRACAHAINRQDLVERLLTGNGTVGSQGWLPPSNSYHEPDVRDYPFDLAEANRLFDEAGYRRTGDGHRTDPDGSPMRYTLHFASVVPRPLIDLVAESLRTVGIDIDLQVVDLVALFGLKLQDNFDLLVTNYPGPSGTGPNGDPDMLRGVYYSKPPNPFHKATGYADPDVDRLIDAQLSTYNVEDRKRIVSQIQKKVAEDVPVVMLYYTDFIWVFKRSVFDQWYYTPGGIGTGLPNIYNKHAFITGYKEGLKMRA
ncbi:MAG TPA: ABC transporter substrate-binding protein [Acidimicrobiales bacterium]|jgi:peptide/nickel transport system substrate-binding protein